MQKIILERQEIIKEEVNIIPCPFCKNNEVSINYSAGEYGYSNSKAYVKCKKQVRK